MLRIAAERIRELEQAVEHGKGLLRDQLERTAEAQMEVLSLRAITSDLKQDAARYRWLRSDDIEVLPGQHEITVVKHRLPFTDDSDETLIESELDAAIDAAMAASKGNDDGE